MCKKKGVRARKYMAVEETMGLMIIQRIVPRDGVLLVGELPGN